MTLSTQPYKGARDFYPDEKRLQKYIFERLRNVCESYGYEEYDAPLLEPTELYATKTSEEIVNEQTYSFTDRGGRNVTLRTEMTPSVSRMVAAKKQELAYPLRWYSIPNIWRYERPQRGRSREFYQLNVDIFGASGIEADFEIIQIADAIMLAFDSKRFMYTININSRKLVNLLLSEIIQLKEARVQQLIRTIDKMHKMTSIDFNKSVDEIFNSEKIDSDKKDLLLAFLQASSLDTLPKELIASAPVIELQRLSKLLNEAQIDNVVFDPSLMRGFDYYNDIVFEVFDTDESNARSMFGGGRYDGLISLFGVESLPTVGFGMGDITLLNFLTTHKLLPVAEPDTDLFVLLVGDVYTKSLQLIDTLRRNGLKIAVDFTDRKPDKKLKNAIKAGGKFVLFIGENEIENGTFMLKNLLTKTEKQCAVDEISKLLKAFND